MTMIQRALQSPDVVEAPRCFEHYFGPVEVILEPLEPMESSWILDILSYEVIFGVFPQSNVVDSGRLERL